MAGTDGGVGNRQSADEDGRERRESESRVAVMAEIHHDGQRRQGIATVCTAVSTLSPQGLVARTLSW